MNNVRYLIRNKNGDYLKQEWDGSLHKVKCEGVDNPLDASHFKCINVAYRVIEETINNSGNLPVRFDTNNPPESVCKFKFEHKKLI